MSQSSTSPTWDGKEFHREIPASGESIGFIPRSERSTITVGLACGDNSHVHTITVARTAYVVPLAQGTETSGAGSLLIDSKGDGSGATFIALLDDDWMTQLPVLNGVAQILNAYRDSKRLDGCTAGLTNAVQELKTKLAESADGDEVGAPVKLWVLEKTE